MSSLDPLLPKKGLYRFSIFIILRCTSPLGLLIDCESTASAAGSCASSNLDRETVLDVGCGSGQLCRALAAQGWAMTGVDFSKRALDLAIQHTDSQMLIDYHLFDLERGDFAQLSTMPYSLITCKLVYVFIADKVRFLQQLSSILREGGMLVVITPLSSNTLLSDPDVAVDYHQTLTELSSVFHKVRSCQDEDQFTYFVCQE